MRDAGETRIAAAVCGDYTIWRMIGRVTDMGMREMDLSDLTEFRVDETQTIKGYNYITVVTRPDTGPPSSPRRGGIPP